MALKCLNCGSPCMQSDTACLSCRGPIRSTDYKLKRDGGLGKKGTAFGTTFMIIGICLWNGAIGPKVMPSNGHNSAEQILAAGGVGMLCGAFGMLLASFLHGTD